MAVTAAAAPPWLSIVGIGEDGRDGLSRAAQTCLAQARLVIGGRRHLALAAPVHAETMVWPSPLAEAIPKICARRGEPTCVLASGDPFFYGVGNLLAAHLTPDDYFCVPAPSSFSLAAARLGWPLQECRLVSLHGRDIRRIIPHLQPAARIIVLTWDATTPALLAELLQERGCGSSHIHVLEAIGGPRERCRHALADNFDLEGVDALNIVALEVVATPGARLLPLAPGLPDAWFDHDGQITRSEVRAITLAALRSFRGAHLWDIGAGSGSVAIEWTLLDPANRATAIEVRPERVARIVRNAGSFGVPDLDVVEGRAPDILAGLAKPDAIFIGGGGTMPLFDTALAALKPGGRLVANAVTLETQAHLIALHGRHGGSLTQIAVAHADPVGRFHGWRPTMPVTQWAMTR